MQDMTNPVNRPSCFCMQDIPIPLNSVLYFFISWVIGPSDLQHSPAPRIRNVKNLCPAIVI